MQAKSCSAAPAIGTLQYHNRGFMAGDLVFGQPTESRNDYAISHLHPPRCGAVDQNFAAAGWTWYRVGFETLAIVTFQTCTLSKCAIPAALNRSVSTAIEPS